MPEDTQPTIEVVDPNAELRDAYEEGNAATEARILQRTADVTAGRNPDLDPSVGRIGQEILHASDLPEEGGAIKKFLRMFGIGKR